MYMRERAYWHCICVLLGARRIVLCIVTCGVRPSQRHVLTYRALFHNRVLLTVVYSKYTALSGHGEIVFTVRLSWFIPSMKPSASTDDTQQTNSPSQSAPGLVVVNEPSLISRLLFLYVDPIVRYGHRYRLEPEDLYKPSSVNTEPLHDLFSQAWQRQLKKRGHPDIKRAVLANSVGGLVFTGFLYAVSIGCQLVGPIMLQRIVGGLQCYARQQAVPSVQCPENAYLY